MQQQRTIVSSYSTASKLLQQCLVKVCAETVQFSHQLQVMGIVCVTIDDEPIEIVVKINDLLQKANEGDDKLNASETDSESLVENSCNDMQAAGAGAKKRRTKRRRRGSGKQSSDSFDVNSSDGAYDSASNNENNSANVAAAAAAVAAAAAAAAAWRNANAAHSPSMIPTSVASNWKAALPFAKPSGNNSGNGSGHNGTNTGANANANANTKSGRFECHACTLRFATARALKNHVQSSGHKAYKCTDCGALRKNWSGLELHCLRHVNVRRWSCMVCNDEFFSRPACIAHLESAHTPELSRAKQPGDLVHTKELDPSAIAYLERMKLANGFSVNQTPIDYAIAKRDSAVTATANTAAGSSTSAISASTSATASASNSRPIPLTTVSKRALDSSVATSALTSNSPNRSSNPNSILFSIAGHSERERDRQEAALRGDAESILKSPPLMSVQSFD